MFFEARFIASLRIADNTPEGFSPWVLISGIEIRHIAAVPLCFGQDPSSRITENVALG
jgi:hypothetical protein